MKTTSHWLLLGDEAPSIGCGWRLCDIQVGRKWVYLRSSGTPYRVRMSLKKLCHIKDTMIRYWERNRRSDNPSQFDTFQGIDA